MSNFTICLFALRFQFRKRRKAIGMRERKITKREKKEDEKKRDNLTFSYFTLAIFYIFKERKARTRIEAGGRREKRETSPFLYFFISRKKEKS